MRLFFKSIRWFFGTILLVVMLVPGAAISFAGFRDLSMKFWSRMALAVFGVRVKVVGELPGPGTFIVMNHVSYFDPIVVGAVAPGSFLAKAEIAKWPLAGVVAKIGKSIFIDRGSLRQSHSWLAPIGERLARGERVNVFAEGGIVGDGENIELFKTMFFQAPIDTRKPLVPVAIKYIKPQDPDVWRWSDGSMGEHLLGKVFPAAGIECEVRFGSVIEPGQEMTRKQLAAFAHARVCELYGTKRVGLE